MPPSDPNPFTIKNATTETLTREVNGLGLLRIPFLLIVDFGLENYYLSTLDELKNSNEILIHLPNFSNAVIPEIISEVQLSRKKTSMNTYKKAFDKVMGHLRQGDSFLTNLTAATPIELTGTLRDLFYRANAPYRIWFKNQWVCFSPETFIKIKGNKIFSFPMKGTISALVPHARKLLLENVKETAEHLTMVDLIRNDLSRVSTGVKVERLRFIQHIKTSTKDLLQMSSKISGKLEKGYHRHLGDILLSLLPAGSISGAPKAKTIEIIRKVENYKRGYYTGVCFVFDGKGVDSCVLIRFVEKTKNGFMYKSGGGITTQSEVEKEFEELNDKIYVPIL